MGSATGLNTSGMWAAGEIGPVSGKSHLHGFTSVFAIFRPRGAKLETDLKAKEQSEGKEEAD